MNYSNLKELGDLLLLGKTKKHISPMTIVQITLVFSY